MEFIKGTRQVNGGWMGPVLLAKVLTDRFGTLKGAPASILLLEVQTHRHELSQ